MHATLSSIKDDNEFVCGGTGGGHDRGAGPPLYNARESQADG